MLKLIISSNLYNIFYPIDMNGLNILHFAVQQGKEKITEFLCMYMKDVDTKDFVINIYLF
jgi:hypothetical protein